MRIVSHGARIEIEASEAWVLGRVREVLPDAVAEAGDEVDVGYSLTERLAAGWLLERRSGARGTRQTLVEGASLDRALRLLESDLHFQVAVHARRGLFVHAGVVGWHERAVVIPGRTRSGKTSLVAALVRAGARYYSDEYAVLGAGGRVHPYAKPLSIRGESGIGVETPVEALGGRAGTTAIPLGLVVSTRYRPHVAWRPRVMSAGESALALLGHVLVARQRPEESLRIVTHAVSGAVGLEGPRGEASEVASDLLRRLDDRP